MKRILNLRIKGFTLLEMLTVIGIMVVIMSVTLPLIGMFGKNIELKGSITQLASLMRLARSLAITRNVVYKVETNLALQSVGIYGEDSGTPGAWHFFDKIWYVPSSLQLAVGSGTPPPAYDTVGTKYVAFKPIGTADVPKGHWRLNKKKNSSEFICITITTNLGRIRVLDFGEY